MKSIKNNGQAMTEYLILTALIGIGSIAIVQVLATNLQSRFAVMSASLRGEKKSLKGVKESEKDYQLKDLGNFQEAMKDAAQQGN